MISIMAATGYKGSLSTLTDKFFLAATAWAAVLAKTLTGSFGATRLMFQSPSAGLCLNCHAEM
jgi:hypothetical protein